MENLLPRDQLTQNVMKRKWPYRQTPDDGFKEEIKMKSFWLLAQRQKVCN